MTKGLLKPVCNENGFVLGASILVSALLLLAGVLALWTSNTEVQAVRNESQLNQEFYEAEAALVDALENYNSGPTQWLTTDFLTAASTEAKSTAVFTDENGHPQATVVARDIQDDGTYDGDPSEPYNHLPQQRHIGPPPSGSGYSLKYFEVRRYGITAISSQGNTQVQMGAWKVFNKY
jgi:hypothetical protein